MILTHSRLPSAADTQGRKRPKSNIPLAVSRAPSLFKGKSFTIFPPEEPTKGLMEGQLLPIAVSATQKTSGKQPVVSGINLRKYNRAFHSTSRRPLPRI
jgi:hypothetical protein